MLESKISYIIDHIRRRNIYVPLLALTAIMLMYTEAGLRNDFDIFLAASKALFEGKDIYTETYFDGYHYYYSTLFAILLYPLGLLPTFLAKSIWIIANLIILARMLRLTDMQFIVLGVRKSLRNIILLFLVLFCLRLIKGNLHLGQMTILILYLSLESLHQLKKGQILWAAFLLALAINIKILPIVLIPYFIYRGQFKVVLATALTLSLMAFGPGLIVGHQYNREMLHSWWELVNPSQQKHLFDLEETSFHSLTTIIPIFFMEETSDRSSIDISRNIFDLTSDQVLIIIHVSRSLFVLATLWFLRTLPLKKSISPVHEWWEISYIFLSIPLIFPHQQHYSFLFIWPAIAYLLVHISNESRRIIPVVFLVIIYLSINAAMLLGFWRHYFEHFKILSFGAILCAIMLAISKPDKKWQNLPR